MFIGLVDSNCIFKKYEHCRELCSLAYVTALQLETANPKIVQPQFYMSVRFFCNGGGKTVLI